MSLKQKADPEIDEREIHMAEPDGSDKKRVIVAMVLGGLFGFLIGGPIGAPIVSAVAWVITKSESDEKIVLGRFR